MSKSEANLAVIMSSTYSQVKIYFHHGKRKEWYFYGKRDSKRYEMEDTDDGTVMTLETGTSSKVLFFARTSGISFGCDSNCIEDVVGFIQHISTIYNAVVTYLEVHPSKLHYLEAIQSVDVLRKSKIVKINEGTVSHEEMRRILEGFETNELEICCNPEPGFTYDRPISIRKLTIKNGFWFKGPMLLNINYQYCETVRVNSTEIAQEHINRLLRYWLILTTGCCAMRSLTISAKSQVSESVYHDSRPQKWAIEKMVQGLSSFKHAFLSSLPENTRKLCRRIDGSIIFLTIYPNAQGCVIDKKLGLQNVTAIR